MVVDSHGNVAGAKQETLEAAKGKQPGEKNDKKEYLVVHDRMVKDLALKEVTIEYLNKSIDELKTSLMMHNTTIQKIVKEDQDSMEMGAQLTGRIKVYGNFNKKQEFAAKINEAIELMEATREKLEKLNGDVKKE